MSDALFARAQRTSNTFVLQPRADDAMVPAPFPSQPPASVELAPVASTSSAASSSRSSSLSSPPSLSTRRTMSSSGPGSRLTTIIDTEAAFSEVQQLATSLVGHADPDEPQSQQLEQLLTTVRSLCNNLCTATEALVAKERENDNLTRVLRELSESRAEAVRVKVLTLESLHKLQDECSRVGKSAQLAQQASRTHAVKVQRVRSELSDTRDELYKARKQIAALQARSTGLRADNELLRRQMVALEKAGVLSGELCSSVCMQHFTSVRPMSLY